MRQKIGATLFALLMVMSASFALVAVTSPATAATGTTAGTADLGTSVSAASGTMTEESYNGRMYLKYVPSSVDNTEEAPVVVMLHGCTQSPSGFADETQMNQVAEEEGFIVIYPDQTSGANQNECWNWFEDRHTTRGSGEAALIAGMTDEVISDHNVDEQQVYLAGFSAGAGTAPAMAVAYPDKYAAVGIHSGLEYDAANGMNDAFTVMSSGGPDPQQKGDDAYQDMGSRADTVPTIVFHGTQDNTVDTVNGRQAAEQATQTIDLALDGGQDDDDIDYDAENTNTGSIAGTSYTEKEYLTPDGHIAVEQYIMDGMGHAWSGGAEGGSYSDPSGPEASQVMWDFFSRHTVDEIGGGMNQAPIASASASSTSVSTGDTVDFDASASTDEDGTIESYEWDLDGDGSVEANGQQASKTYNEGGIYDVTLTVTDDDGESSTDTVSVTVDAPGNNSPSASIDASTTTVTEGDSMDFDGSGSTDSDGSIESYEWDFDGDGTTDATGQSATHTYSSPGTYEATLTVTDNEGAQATSTVSITVNEFSGYCGTAYPYEHEDNGRAVSNSDGSYSAVGSGDDLGFGGSQVTLEETSENYYEKVDSCDGNNDDGGDDDGGNDDGGDDSWWVWW